MHLLGKLPFRLVVHLVDQATDLRPQISLQIFFGDDWRRRIGECLDLHDIKVSAAGLKIRATTGAEEWSVVGVIVVSHRAIVTTGGMTIAIFSSFSDDLQWVAWLQQLSCRSLSICRTSLSSRPSFLLNGNRFGRRLCLPLIMWRRYRFLRLLGSC